jgi:transcriptional regulator with XRE-family HTH domain
MDRTGRSQTRSTATGDTYLAAPFPPVRPGGNSGPPAPGTATEPSPAPPPRTTKPDGREWGDWRRQIGRRLRALRELTGLSQDRLARVAGVNQAAVSRLENGKGLVSVSLLTRLGGAIGDHLADRTLLSEDGARLLAALETLAPIGREPARPVTPDPEIRYLIHCYLRASEPQRKAILAVCRALGGQRPRGGR